MEAHTWTFCTAARREVAMAEVDLSSYLDDNHDVSIAQISRLLERCKEGATSYHYFFITPHELWIEFCDENKINLGCGLHPEVFIEALIKRWRDLATTERKALAELKQYNNEHSPH
jgi:hypothetical protein